MRAPTSAPFDGRRKLDVAMAPLLVRGPVMMDASVLTNVQVPPRFHELLLLDAEPRDWLVPLDTDRLRVRLPDESAESKPVPSLLQAVLWSSWIAPGLPLSMNPPAELSHAMLLRV